MTVILRVSMAFPEQYLNLMLVYPHVADQAQKDIRVRPIVSVLYILNHIAPNYET